MLSINYIGNQHQAIQYATRATKRLHGPYEWGVPKPQPGGSKPRNDIVHLHSYSLLAYSIVEVYV